MGLFDEQRRRKREEAAPLAVRMRPRTLDEFVGQEHFVGPGKLLHRMLNADRLSSTIFYGPPGTGKTTLAGVIAATTRAHFEQLNAAGAGVKEVRALLESARARLESTGQRSVLFVDELHRFNRSQQDVLLNDVEDGVVILLGATTENPFFALNTPLLSRSQIFEFQPLTVEQIESLLRRALSDTERGLGRYNAVAESAALRHLAVVCDGDARRALNALEVAVLSQIDGKADDGSVSVTESVAAESIQRKAIRYDAGGDEHYDAASALIKSIRGSDPDAAIYWLARMMEGGEDPRFIARRLVIAAAEDIGNADPMGLVLAQAAADATNFIGLPECQLPLAQATIYLACSEKSNSATTAISAAREDVRSSRTIPVPKHLQSSSYAGAKRLDRGEGYRYPHDHDGGMVAQEYLGVDRQFYYPVDRGRERELARYLERFKALRPVAPPEDAT
ncbi:MAG: replication-associated recombination protein A [Phycisphaerales bacterium]|nr:replication-associated recombination protein A [Phycisphaerales bacterium]